MARIAFTQGGPQALITCGAHLDTQPFILVTCISLPSRGKAIPQEIEAAAQDSRGLGTNSWACFCFLSFLDMGKHGIHRARLLYNPQ